MSTYLKANTVVFTLQLIVGFATWHISDGSIKAALAVAAIIALGIFAVAIVTDLGGILSHAAIVSHELKIPCITSAQNATQLIKTGDLIEVDADTGNITILKG